MSEALGVDVGGTSLRAAVVSPQGELVRANRRTINDRSPQGVIGLMAELVEELDVAGTAMPMVVGIAGQTLVETGTVAVAPNLGWIDVPLTAMLRERFNAPVRVVNDLAAIAVGEAACGAGQGTRDLMCIFVGTGVGMGAVLGGQVVEGADGLATELGHVKVASVETGRLCGCGERGCLEAYTSGRHLPEVFAAKVAAGGRSSLWDEVGGNLDELTPDRIDQAAAAGDPVAQSLWQEVAEQLALAVGAAITILNPRVLVWGGGVLQRAKGLQRQLDDRLRAVTSRPHFDRLRVCTTTLGDHAGLVGAGLLAHELT